MTERKVCKHCGEPVRTINYAMGPELMHYNPGASFPTERNGDAWRYCQITRAELASEPTS